MRLCDLKNWKMIVLYRKGGETQRKIDKRKINHKKHPDILRYRAGKGIHKGHKKIINEYEKLNRI